MNMLAKNRNDIEILFHDHWLSSDVVYQSADALPHGRFITLDIQPLRGKKSLSNDSSMTEFNIKITAYDETMYAADLLIDELQQFVDDNLDVQGDVTFGYSGSTQANMWYQDIVFTIQYVTPCQTVVPPAPGTAFGKSYNKQEIK